MNVTVIKKIGVISVFCIALSAFALYFPMICYGEETCTVEASPNIINIDGQRWGDIRIFTNLRYANYDFYGDDKDSEVFVYINPIDGEVSESVANIVPSRDSWGNLILRFGLEDLLEKEDLLNIDDYNTFQVVVIKNEGGVSEEYIGQDDDVFIMDNKGS